MNKTENNLTLESLKKEMSEYLLFGVRPELVDFKDGEGYLCWVINERISALLHLTHPRGWDSENRKVVLDYDRPMIVFQLDSDQYTLVDLDTYLSEINDLTSFKQDLIDKSKIAIEKATEELIGMVERNKILLGL